LGLATLVGKMDTGGLLFSEIDQFDPTSDAGRIHTYPSIVPAILIVGALSADIVTS